MKKLLAFLAVPILAIAILISCVALPDLGVIEPQQVAGRTLSVAGLTTLNGGLVMDSPAFSVADGTGNTVISGTLTISDTATLVGAVAVDSATVGGGYGATGCSISAAGVLQCNGAATTDGALTADSAVVGGGYGATGATISTAGVGQFNGALTTDGALTADSVVAGGGYGSTGCTLSTAGVLQCNGAATTDGAITADSAVIGGGYGSTGATISTAGLGQFNGALTADGLLTANGGIAVDSTAFTVADVTGNVQTAGTLVVIGSAEIANGITVDTDNFTVSGTTGAVSSKGDITTVADATGGNAAAKNEFIGLPRIKLVSLGAGTNPASQTIALVDDSPTGEYAPVDADVTEAEGSTDSIYKYGASSYKAIFADTAAADDGFIDAALGANASWEDMESIGLLVYVTTTLTSGDLQLAITDNGGVRKFNIPAVATANKWTWVEVDISSLGAGTGDVISDFAVTLTAQGATNLAAFTIYVDIAYVWDAADEEALSAAIQQDGVLSVVSVATAGASVNTTTDLVELTDYLVHYESGNDFIVWITDQSANSNLALIAY